LLVATFDLLTHACREVYATGLPSGHFPEPLIQFRKVVPVPGSRPDSDATSFPSRIAKDVDACAQNP
jgi:hypothetical protein